jgi:hypothetical protein
LEDVSVEVEFLDPEQAPTFVNRLRVVEALEHHKQAPLEAVEESEVSIQQEQWSEMKQKKNKNKKKGSIWRVQRQRPLEGDAPSHGEFQNPAASDLKDASRQRNSMRHRGDWPPTRQRNQSDWTKSTVPCCSDH